MKSKNIIWGINDICEYTGIGKRVFYRLVRHGFPVAVIEGKWCAHAENLEDFFRRGTLKPPADIPEDVE